MTLGCRAKTKMRSETTRLYGTERKMRVRAESSSATQRQKMMNSYTHREECSYKTLLTELDNTIENEATK